ncbi:hypothetical protein PS676_05713 [Pseudomonas fluorescens]|nr:hypothetical protein PS676_05713 [Pseudomonas fluorescens]
MGAQHFAVQAVAFEVADDLAVEIDLVQVAAAVIQAIDPAAVGQLGLDQVAEFVIVILQAASRALFFEQLAEGVVGEAQGLCVAVVVGEGDGGELVQRVVGVVGAAIVGDFGDQPSDGVALQSMNDGGQRRLGDDGQTVAERRRSSRHRRDVIQQVIGVALGAAVEVLLFSQPIGGIPGKPITLVIFVGQRLQPPVAVVPELHLPAVGVGALADLAAAVVLIERGVPGRVRITDQLAADVALILLGAPVRQLATEQAPLGVVAELGAFAEGVGDDLQIAPVVVAEPRRVTRAIDVLDQLAERVPAQLFAFAGGVDDLDDLAVGVVAVAGDVSQRIGFGDAVAALIIAVPPTVAGGVGVH